MITHVTFGRREHLPGTVAPLSSTFYADSKSEALAEARLRDSLGIARNWSSIHIVVTRTMARCEVNHRCPDQGEGSMVWEFVPASACPLSYEWRPNFRFSGAKFFGR